MADSGLLYTRNVLVIGNIGSGKSTVINKLINSNSMKTGFSLSRITTKIEIFRGTMTCDSDKHFSLLVIDSVGMIDPDVNPSKEMTDLRLIKDLKEKISSIFTAGVNIILIVLNIEQLRSEGKQLIQLLKNNFYSKFWKKCHLVFTHCELLSESAIKERLQDIKEKLLHYFPQDFEWIETRIITVGFFEEKDIDKDYEVAFKKKVKNEVFKLRKAVMDAEDFEPNFNLWKHKK